MARYKVEEREAILEAYHASGMTQRAFSEQAGVKFATLQYWIYNGVGTQSPKVRLLQVKTAEPEQVSQPNMSATLKIGASLALVFEALPPVEYLARLARELD